MTDCSHLQHYQTLPNAPHVNDCKSSADVWARARRVVEMRRGRSLSKYPPKVIIASPPTEPEIQIDFVKTLSVALCLLEKDSADKTITIRKIQDAVCRAANIHRNELLSPRRAPAIVLPRQIAIALCKELTLASFPEIGRQFKRDHSTCIFSTTKMIPVIQAIQPFLKDDNLDKIAEKALSIAPSVLPPRKVYRNGARP